MSMTEAKADPAGPSVTTVEAGPAAAVDGLRLDLQDLDRLRPRRRDRMRLAAVLCLSLLLHASPLLLMDRTDDVVSPVEEAIPVEIVVEPPQPEAPQPEPPQAEEVREPEQEPKQPEQALDEKPASDFARAADQDEKDGKSDRLPEKQDEKTPDKPPEQSPAKPEPTPQQKADLEPDPAPGEPLAAAKPPEPEPVAPAPAAPAYQSDAFMPPLPDYQFEAPPAKRTQDPRGSGDPGYLSTLYGRIMKRMQAPPAPPGSRNFRGRIVFSVTRNGALGGASVAVPSGLHALDTAALTAIRRAAPFPPPPTGGPIHIQFDYGTR